MCLLGGLLPVGLVRALLPIVRNDAANELLVDDELEHAVFYLREQLFFNRDG